MSHADSLPEATPAVPKLAEALDFRPEELEQNRLGQLSNAQRARLQQRAGCSLIGGTALVLGLSGIGFWMLALGAWLVAGGLFAIAAVLLMLNRAGRATTRTEAATGKVVSLTGEAELEFNDYATPNGRMNEYVVRIKDQAFVVSQEVFAAFEDGDDYTIYYLPAARVLLSAEPATPA